MYIGDEVYVHGYIDEVRYDETGEISVVIIRNEGGYFGTAESEVYRAIAEQTEPNLSEYPTTTEDCSMVAERKCGNCYYYSDVAVKTCDLEHDPTTAEAKACDRWEQTDCPWK